MELVEEKVDMSIYTNLSVCVWIYTCVNKPIFESTLLCTSVRLYENEEMEEKEENMRKEGGGRKE